MSMDSYSFFALAVATEESGGGFFSAFANYRSGLRGFRAGLSSWVLQWGWCASRIFTPVCMLRAKGILYPQC